MGDINILGDVGVELDDINFSDLLNSPRGLPTTRDSAGIESTAEGDSALMYLDEVKCLDDLSCPIGGQQAHPVGATQVTQTQDQQASLSCSVTAQDSHHSVGDSCLTILNTPADELTDETQTCATSSFTPDMHPVHPHQATNSTGGARPGPFGPYNPAPANPASADEAQQAAMVRQLIMQHQLLQHQQLQQLQLQQLQQMQLPHMMALCGQHTFVASEYHDPYQGKHVIM